MKCDKCDSLGGSVDMERTHSIFYAIRHDPTGHFLPRAPHGRGFTHFEPQPLSSETRLFGDKPAAKRALTWWLNGVVLVGHYNFDYEGSDETWTTVPQEGRKADEMSIVKVTLSI